jgi:hypothetical protein
MKHRSQERKEPALTEPDAKRGILADIDAEHAAWMELARRLSHEQRINRPAAGWSFGEMFLHVASWKENALKVARLQADPDAPYPAQELTPADVLGLEVSRFDEDFMTAHRDWSLDQSLVWCEAVHRDLVRALDELPVERILGGKGPRGARLWYWSPAVIKSQHHRSEAAERFDSS